MKNNSQKPYLTYALNKDGYLVYVDNVPKGNDCSCICPHCASNLCAKNGGEYNAHHFAHLSGVDCKGAVESALHIMAKEVLQKRKCICLPSIKPNEQATLLHFDKVDVEFYDKNLALRPDCVGTYGDKIIWIEFKRTHAVDKKKKQKIISARIECIEIDINSCALNPREVEDFLVNQETKRVWVYNSNLRFSILEDREKRMASLETGSNFETYINRNFAVDDIGEVVHLNNLDSIDAKIHTYYCPACGKEVYIDVVSNGNYRFLHMDDNVVCTDELYLIETSKSILYNRFKSSETFEIFVDQKHICKDNSSCEYFVDSACSVEKPIRYDLKKHGYDSCEKDVKLHNSNMRVPLVILRYGSLCDAIVVRIHSGDCCVIEPTSYREIILNVDDEDHLERLKKDVLKCGSWCFFRNFKNPILSPIVDKKDVGRQVLRFTSFKSGKSFLQQVSCKYLFSQRKLLGVADLYFYVEGDCGESEVYRYGLLHCYKKGIKSCYCRLCCYLNDNFNEPICIRYKTKGTPHYPLKDHPIECPYFRLKNLGGNSDDGIRLLLERYE